MNSTTGSRSGKASSLASSMRGKGLSTRKFPGNVSVSGKPSARSVVKSMYSGRSSVTSMSTHSRRRDHQSKRNLDYAGHANLIVDPETGEDRTPQSLVHTSETRQGERQRRDRSSAPSPTASVSDIESQYEGASTILPISRPGSRAGSQNGSLSPRSMMTDEEYGTSQTGSPREGSEVGDFDMYGRGHDDETAAKPKAATTAAAEIAAAEVEEVHLTEAELNSEVEIYLTETETFTLFSQSSLSVANDGPTAEAVRQKNDAYVSLVKNREGNDKYVERGMVTFNNTMKSKDVQVDALPVAHTESSVSSWEIYDVYNSLAEAAEADIDEAEQQKVEGANADQQKGEGGNAETIEDDEEEEEEEGEEEDEGGLLEMGAAAAEDGGAGGDGEEEGRKGSSSRKEERILQLPSMMENLLTIERIVIQNIFHDQQNRYRYGLPDTDQIVRSGLQTLNLIDPSAPPPEKAPKTADSGNSDNSDLDDGRPHSAGSSEAPTSPSSGMYSMDRDPLDAGDGEAREGEGDEENVEGEVVADSDIYQVGLKHLWTFSCDFTRDVPVSQVVWNPVNTDILAVGHGSSANSSGGLICCWSIMNPVYPERIIQVPSAVCTVSFSEAHPNLLAAGCRDGTLALYDVRQRYKVAQVGGKTNGCGDWTIPGADQSTVSVRKHMDAVWNVQWVDKGEDREEALVSISSDGRIVQWSIKKGLEHTTLMKLNRLAQTTIPTGAFNGGASGGNRGEAFTMRQAGGLCFDFSPDDPNLYLAGTEDGSIHRCSCSYNERYLENYLSHTGPVNRLRWSPFYGQAFVSCSSDWTIKVWDSELVHPVLSVQPASSSITDVCWSPHRSTVMASVSGDGRIDMWDLGLNALDPVHTVKLPGRVMSTVAFGRKADVLVTGDYSGRVEIFNTIGVHTREYNATEQREMLQTALSQGREELNENEL